METRIDSGSINGFPKLNTGKQVATNPQKGIFEPTLPETVNLAEVNAGANIPGVFEYLFS